MEIILADRVDHRLLTLCSHAKLISIRNLSPNEISLCRERQIKKLFLPELNEKERKEYFKEFDRFWNDVVKTKSSINAFWRNGLSSKMQEGGNSLGYLTLILFTLNTLRTASINILFVVSRIEEYELIESWGKKNQWNVNVYRKNKQIRILRRFKQEIINWLNLFRLSYGFLKKKRQLEKPSLVNDRKKRILIVSRFQQESFRDKIYTDPYWGKIHDVCLSKGYSVTYLFNTVGNKGYNAYQRCNGKLETLFPLAVISWRQMLSDILKVSVRGYRSRPKQFMGCDFTRLLKLRFRKFDHAFNFISEFYFSAIKKLGQRSGYEKLLCLYEGNCFERACIQAFNQYMGGTILSYSHGVIYPINLKLRRVSGEGLKPRAHQYFCTGPKSKEALLEVGGNRNPDLIQSGCAMRYIPEMKVLKPLRAKTNILVALDGVWSTVSMLEWLFENEHVFERYQVTLRSHPNVPLRTLLKLSLHKKPERFKASGNTLSEDLENCFCVIYRQSSVGMQAILHELPVIHLGIDSPLPSDPIMRTLNVKWTARSPEELASALTDIRGLTQQEIQSRMREAKEYIGQYFAQSNEDDISNLIEGN